MNFIKKVFKFGKGKLKMEIYSLQKYLEQIIL